MHERGKGLIVDKNFICGKHALQTALATLLNKPLHISLTLQIYRLKGYDSKLFAVFLRFYVYFCSLLNKLSTT